MRPDSPGPVFLSAVSQLETYKHPFTTTLAPIEYVAPLLQAAAIDFATELDRDTERILSEPAQSAESLSLMWRENQRSSQRLESIVRNILKGLSTAGWSQGVSTRITKLHQEYSALLQSSRSVGQSIKDSIQQISNLQFILETQKGLQQADSVRRWVNLSTLETDDG